jgi:hypothetical protein
VIDWFLIAVHPRLHLVQKKSIFYRKCHALDNLTGLIRRNCTKKTMKRIFFVLSLIVACQSVPDVREVYADSRGAIRGYDPVAYFKMGKAVEGEDQFTFQWKNATWKFSNAENLEDFKNDPEKYAPQFGGYCAYGVADDHKASTSPDAWTIADGKLYLNYNADVRNLWREKQLEYIETAVRNWPTVKLQKD